METTRESAHEESHKHLVNDLQALLEKNYDAERGFKKALEDSKDGKLKHFMKTQAVKRNRFATELDKEIRSLNEQPKENGSAAGSMHRSWIDFKTAVTGNKDESVLEECIRGEKSSLKEYEEKLKKHKFPTRIEAVLQKQKSEIQETLNKVKSLEDLEEAK